TSCYPEPPTAMANTVVELAKKKHLINLTKFWWFWDWGPLEQVWTALRSACPLLKNIGIRCAPCTKVLNPGSSVSVT
ncbi:hypothetical protein P691DRAFT_806308, partial [Macrolepiota fuliginosa MF-IS2]